MKLETEIKPRKDGTVKVAVGDAIYEFKGEDRLTCEVKDKGHLAHLLSLGSFFPFDSAAIPTALSYVEESQAGLDPEGEGEELSDDEGNETALPVEAHTPPARFKPKAKK